MRIRRHYTNTDMTREARMAHFPTYSVCCRAVDVDYWPFGATLWSGISQWGSKVILNRYIALVCLIAVTGCATPNIQPMAEQSAALAASVKQQNAAVGSRFAKVTDLVSASPFADLKMKSQLDKSKTNYTKTVQIVDSLVDLAAAYTAEIAVLGAAGEKGGEAADQLVDTLQKFPGVLGYANPLAELPAGLAGSVAGRVIREAASAFTRVQAQDSLLKTMEGADNAIQKLADGLIEIYGRPQRNGSRRPMHEIVTELAVLQINSQRDAFGRTRIKFYEDGLKELEVLYGSTGENLYNDQSEPEFSKRLTNAKGELEVIGKLRAQLANLRKDYEQLQENIAAIGDWRDRRIEVGFAIADAAAAWGLENQHLLSWFRKCAGTRIFRGRCNDFSVQNLQAQLKRIQIILEGARDANAQG